MARIPDTVTLWCGDCLERMKDIPDHSVDMVLCDLPYGTTGLKWDFMIDLSRLWLEYARIIKEFSPIVLFAQQPFTTLLINSNMAQWKYNWIWEKESGTNFVNANYCPMKVTEDICVFGDGAISYTSDGGKLKYFPQFTEGKPYVCTNGNSKKSAYAILHSNSKVCGWKTENDGKRYPKNILRFNRDKNKVHPTQKPVALCAYLIRTYTMGGGIVLDNCMGSGTTGVACMQEGRRFIGIEKEPEYFAIAEKRIADEAAIGRFDFGGESA